MVESKLILEAIVQKRCFEATYNKARTVLAPHILYTKHDDLFVDAVAVERDGLAPRELKLGTYKLAGLNDGVALARSFERFEGFDPTDAKYGEAALLAID